MGKAFQAEGMASVQASGGNIVSKRKSVGHEIRKAAGLTSRRGVAGHGRDSGYSLWSCWRELSLWS